MDCKGTYRDLSFILPYGEHSHFLIQNINTAMKYLFLTNLTFEFAYIQNPLLNCVKANERRKI